MKRKWSRRGFTLLEILVVISIIALLSAVLMGFIGRGRATAHRAQCDVKLKGIALALDAYRSQHGQYPKDLDLLVTEKYLPNEDALKCPSDARPNGSYSEYYVKRAPRDDASLPVLVCPLHENTGEYGAQAFLGRYTEAFTTKPAVLTSANDARIERPDGKGEFAVAGGTELHGGDRIRTGGAGAALITFADGSTAALSGNSDVTVLQSFLDGRDDAPLYTLIKQTLGEAMYNVHHGSKFDVSTPTATAGARGTQFKITVVASGDMTFHLYSGKVVLTTVERSAWAPVGQDVGILTTVLNLLGLPGLGIL